MMAFLLSHPDAGFKIQGAQVIRVTRGRLEPAQLKLALDYLDAVLDRIPDHVWRSLRSPGRG